MYQVQQTCRCGQKYWPNQKWIHEKCGVVNHQETTTTATNGTHLIYMTNPKMDILAERDRPDTVVKDVAELLRGDLEPYMEVYLTDRHWTTLAERVVGKVGAGVLSRSRLSR